MLTRWDKSNSIKARSTKQGASIIEVIVAIGIFTIVASNIIVLYLGSYSTSLRSEERLTAQMLLQEGLTAVSAISNYSYSNLTVGTHGVTDANGYWELSGSNNVIGQYTRTVQVANANRAGGSLISNSNCAIATSGGQTDPNTKLVTVTVAWDLETGNATTLQGTEYITNWRNQQGCGQSSWISEDASQAYITTDNLTIGDIDLTNSASGGITLSTITPTWSSGAMLETITISGNTLWESNSDPLNYVPPLASGSQITANLAISASSSINIEEMSFSSSMADEAITFWITMSDGTARYFEVNDTPGDPPDPPPPPPPPGDQGDDMDSDINSARLINRDKKLIGIVVENTGDEDIEIDKITVTWSWGHKNSKIRRIWIDGDRIWNKNQSSGTELDVTNFELEPGEQYPLEALFNKDMWGTLIIIQFTMADGSTAFTDTIWAF